MAAILCAPCLGFGYLWDDYFFLTSGAKAHLLPSSNATFYRPIPLAGYFGALSVLDPSHGTLAHILSLTVLLGAIVLLTLLVSRLCGSRAGILAGLVFAAYGQVAAMVGWISASQDLFAILFVIAALYCRDRGWDVAAIACAAAALLCKETALAVLALLVFWDSLVGRPAGNRWLTIVGCVLVLIGWAAIHPGLHQLLGGHSTSIGYVGVGGAGLWAFKLGRYFTTLFNLPPWGLHATWRPDLTGYAFAALLVMLLTLRLASQRERGTQATTLPLTRVLAIAALLAIPSLLLPVVLVRYSAPHFTCMAAMGVAIFLGPALARQNTWVAGLALTVFLFLGIFSRGVKAQEVALSVQERGDPWIGTETSMIETSEAARDVRGNFKKVLPSLQKGSQVVVSMGPIGRGLQMELVDGQALRLWYGDPTLHTTLIRDRRSGAASEILVRITNGLDVIAIDPDTGKVRSAYGAEPDPKEINRPLKNYARALAAGGETDRAIRIVRTVDRTEAGDLNVFNRRLIASMLLAAGRRSEADSVMKDTPAFARDVALQAVTMLQAEASSSERLDTSAFEALGLSSHDPETLRWIMRDLGKNGFTSQSAWFAQKLKAVAPADREAADVLDRAARAGIQPQREPGRLGALAL